MVSVSLRRAPPTVTNVKLDPGVNTTLTCSSENSNDPPKWFREDQLLRMVFVVVMLRTVCVYDFCCGPLALWFAYFTHFIGTQILCLQPTAKQTTEPMLSFG